MPRTVVPLSLPDVSVFARSLGRALHERQLTKPTPPSHVELLNLIARVAGHRNFQALKVAPAPVPPTPPVTTAALTIELSDNARKALGHFDAQGRLQRWPVKYSVQQLVMWVMWTRFDAKRTYTEKEVNAILKDANAFGDHVTLRRELINHRLMARKSDCSEYTKLPARPDEETRALLAAWRSKARAA